MLDWHVSMMRERSLLGPRVAKAGPCRASHVSEVREGLRQAQ